MTFAQNTIAYTLITGFALMALVTAPIFAQAANYAYVDALGEVKMVTANDWMTAIAVAPNIHINSGVFLLTSASDLAAVGDKVPSVK